MVSSIIIGFVLGLIVSVINHLLLVRAAHKLEMGSDAKATKKFASRYIFRYFSNFALLFVIYFYIKDNIMLIAAAFGLTSVKNFILGSVIFGKKGVK